MSCCHVQYLINILNKKCYISFETFKIGAQVLSQRNKSSVLPFHASISYLEKKIVGGLLSPFLWPRNISYRWHNILSHGPQTHKMIKLQRCVKKEKNPNKHRLKNLNSGKRSYSVKIKIILWRSSRTDILF